MSTYTDASLIVTPNAYKAGKLYSIKPTSGAGDLNVLRATSATRVNEQGLIEIPRTNLVLRSEEFNDSYWTKTRSSISANATTSPDGNLTADKLIENTDTNSHFIDRTFTTTAGVVYTYSVYAKKSEREFIVVECLTTGKAIFVNLNDGSLGTRIGYLVSDINVETLLNGWFRISVKDTSPSTVLRYINTIAISSSSVSYEGNGTSGLFLWGAQLEVGNVATEYIPTTSVIRTRFAGITQDGGSASNIPRIDYTNGSCPSILVEPQRTNLLLRSEEFDNASWTKTASTVTANATTSPRGTITADLLTSSSTTGFISQGTNTVIGTTYTLSIYIKNIDAISTAFLGRVSSNNYSFGINWNGSVISSITNIVGNATFQLINNGWYRITCVFNSLESTIGHRIYADNTIINKSVYIWGAQLEAGANATSYIPTIASTVTRNADVIYKNVISSLIGQTEGTFFAELFSPFNSTIREISLGDGSIDNRISFGYFNVSNRFTLQVVKNGAFQVNNTSIEVNQNITNKIALSYALNNYKLFINGILVFTDNDADVFTNQLSSLQLNRGFSQNPYFGRINSIQLYKTALTDEQCIALTTL